MLSAASVARTDDDVLAGARPSQCQSHAGGTGPPKDRDGAAHATFTAGATTAECGGDFTVIRV
jgi:hypothetical protein